VPAGFTALFDSCVLYPAPLRDLLMSLATSGLFRARWSPHIHEEWMRAVLNQNKDNSNVTAERLERTRQLMDANVLDSVVTGYEKLINGIVLPDANDRHVVAAAIRAGADVIVTYNLKHFPDAALAEFGMHAEHPDTFVSHLFDLDSAVACRAVKQHRARLKNPPVDVAGYLDALQRQELTETVAILRTFSNLI
jgi:predicted nucleic acid-binding protein